MVLMKNEININWLGQGKVNIGAFWLARWDGEMGWQDGAVRIEPYLGRRGGMAKHLGRIDWQRCWKDMLGRSPWQI